MTSEKLKNEILPLLNGTEDDDIDDLDDEVAMISNKRDILSAEDIKLTFKEEKKQQPPKPQANN